MVGPELCLLVMLGRAMRWERHTPRLLAHARSAVSRVQMHQMGQRVTAVRAWRTQRAPAQAACARGPGVRQLRDHPTLGFLYSYFERVRKSDMNAWDISVTRVHGGSNAEAFRPHYDRTLTDHIRTTANVGGLQARMRAAGGRPAQAPRSFA